MSCASSSGGGWADTDTFADTHPQALVEPVEPAGLQVDAVVCDFVSRWGSPDDPASWFSVVGPMTIPKVSG